MNLRMWCAEQNYTISYPEIMSEGKKVMLSRADGENEKPTTKFVE